MEEMIDKNTYDLIDYYIGKDIYKKICKKISDLEARDIIGAEVDGEFMDKLKAAASNLEKQLGLEPRKERTL